MRRIKPRFEYIGFVQRVQAPLKTINKINELDDFLATEGFIQPGLTLCWIHVWQITAVGYDSPMTSKATGPAKVGATGEFS